MSRIQSHARFRRGNVLALFHRMVVPGFLAVAVMSVLSCVKDPESDPTSEELDFERVEDAPTSVLSPQADGEVEQRPSSGRTEMAGLLPGNYPEDLPVFLPSELVDYGVDDDGRRFIQLRTSQSTRLVDERLARAWGVAGWQPGESTWSKDDREAAWTSSSEETGTQILVYY